MRISCLTIVERFAFGLICAVLMSGCHVTYRYSYEPSTTREDKTQGKYHLRNCRVVLNGKELPEDQMSKAQCKCGHCSCELWGFTRESLDRIQSARPEVFADIGTPVDIVVCVDLENQDSSLVSLSGWGALFTLGIIPCWTRIDRQDRIRLLVGESRVESEFMMSEECSRSSSSSGLNRLFPYGHRTDVRFTREGSGSSRDSINAKRDCKIEAYASAIAATLAQMEKEGKLPGTAQENAGSRTTDSAAGKFPETGRVRELRQLYEAGVISKEEYNAELEKVGKEMRK